MFGGGVAGTHVTTADLWPDSSSTRCVDFRMASSRGPTGDEPSRGVARI